MFDELRGVSPAAPLTLLLKCNNKSVFASAVNSWALAVSTIRKKRMVATFLINANPLKNKCIFKIIVCLRPINKCILILNKCICPTNLLTARLSGGGSFQGEKMNGQEKEW